MKKVLIGLGIIIIIIILAIIGFFTFRTNTPNTSSNSSNTKNLASQNVYDINVTKINSKDNIVKVIGQQYINEEVIKYVLDLNDISGAQVDIQINSDSYNGIQASAILNACNEKLGLKLEKKDYDLANILVSSATGLDRFDTKQNVANLIIHTNRYFREYHSTSGLYMGTPNRILADYSPKIKNDTGADSLYVQMCIFLNEYYNNLENPNNNNNNNSSSSNSSIQNTNNN